MNRSVQPATLTSAGWMLRSLASDILRSVYAARTLVFSFFPNWPKRLNRGFGAVTARVLAVNVPKGVQQLVEGDCDLFIGYYHGQLPILLDPNRFPFLTLEQEVVRLDPELECEWERPIPQPSGHAADAGARERSTL